MWINPINIEKQNKLIADYRQRKSEIMSFFEYHTTDRDLNKRVQDLSLRTFQRDSLREVLHKLNSNWDAPSSTLKNIERLSDENSVVVIAGQQAGLLTGPLYTINKIISILQLAKQQEERLKIPVIPIFWIAGEDHDFEEINHVYVQNKNRLKKMKVDQYLFDKCSVSDIELDKRKIENWIHKLFINMEETQYTKQLYDLIKDGLNKSLTYTDFFAQLIFKLFPNEGLVLIDSHHPLIRKLESDYFVHMIEKQNEISTGVSESLDKLSQFNYDVPLDVHVNDGNLFYHDNNERILLIKNKEQWIGKNNEICFSTEELIKIAQNQPEKLSNNVVTRPLMQELLFPSLAFIAGPGEISYWSALKPAFDAINIKMPPVFPRLSFTYIEPKVNKILEQFNLSPEEVVNGGLEEYKKQWIESKTKPPIQQLSKQIIEQIEQVHKPLRELAREIRSDIGDLAEKNLNYLQKEVTFLENRMLRAVEEKYEKELNEIDYLNISLHPGGLQERIWNPLPFINKYGFYFIQKTTEYPCSFEQDHYLVYL